MAHPRAGPPTIAPERASGLHERDAELERIATALDSAGGASGELLLVEGPAGIGKTALIRAAQHRARERGMQVLGARASEIDCDLSFGAVRQLLEPPLRKVGAERRRALLAGAAGLAAPALGLADDSSAPEPGPAMLHGFYWLLANLVEDGPALLTIDDAHWADASSVRLLAFVAPRLEDLACVILVAARVEDGGGMHTLAATASDPAARPLLPAPLSGPACAAIVAERVAAPVATPFAEACHTVSGGNPFYLHALVDELVRDGVSPTAAAAPAVLASSPASVARTIIARLATMGPATVALARSLAVLGDETEPATVAWLADLAPGDAIAALDRLEEAGIVRGGDRVDFVHGIVRNAVYSDLGRAERASLHRRIAERLRAEGTSAQRIAAHVVATPSSGSADDLAVLRAAATEALGRGAPESAVAYLQRALSEPLDAADRAGVLFQLGLAETGVDLGAATEHLRQALDLTDDPGRRTLIRAVLARAVFFTVRARDSIRIAQEALAEVDPAATAVRQGLEAIILAAASMEPAETRIADEVADRVRRTGVQGDGLDATALEAALVYRDARASLAAGDAVARVEHALRGDVLLDQDNGRAAFCAAATILAMADSDRALALLENASATARSRGDLIALAGDRVFAGLVHLVRGELPDAVASAEEGLTLAKTYGGDIGIPWGSAFLAAAHLERGDLDAAERALGFAWTGADVPDTAHWHTFLDSRARLRARRGDLRGALDEALECGRRFESVGGRNPAFVPWRSRAAHYLARLGEDPHRARALAAEEVDLAEAWGAPRALGRALRVHGLLCEGDDGTARLRAAVETLDGSPARLEHARALVDLGARLRRTGNRSEARQPLGAGLKLARACGAVPLAERAYEELRATGARPRKILVTGVDALTPSELRVARSAAQGATNREIAQELFVTVKTVEFHLGHVYRKLGILARDALPAALER